MRSLRFLSLLVAAPFLASAQSARVAEVIALPEFKVFEDRPLPPPEKWDYVRVGNFEILSNASPRDTKRFAKDLYEFQNVLAIVAPHMLIRAEQPVMVVLCGKSKTFDGFAARSAIPTTRGHGTSLVRDQEVASIVVDYQTKVVSDPDAAMAVSDGRGGWFTDLFAEREVHTSEEFIRQYIHLSLSQLNPRPPAWVAEGLANIYSSIDYNNKWIEIGKPSAFLNEVTTTASYSSYGGGGFSSGFSDRSSYPGAYGSGSGFSGNYGNYGGYGSYDPFREFNETRTYRVPLRIMPMAQMFAINYDSPMLKGIYKYADTPLNGWRQQVTAFVHLCIFGENGKYRRPFFKFYARALNEGVSEELFKECFGMSYKDMALEIRGYTEFTRYSGTIIEATKGNTLYPSDPVKIRAANDAEIGRIKGETYRLSGNEEAARNEFVMAYLRGERDPQLLASLGLMARQRGDTMRARTYLEAVGATPAPVPRPRAYLEIARLRAVDYAARSGAAPYTLDQTIGLLTPLFVAQRQPQQLLDIYLEIARVWENTSVKPERDHLGALEYGVRLFPFSGELILRTSALLIQHGYGADAAPMLQRAINSTRDQELKTKLEALRAKVAGGPSAAPGFSLEENLAPELRTRLTDYRATKAAALNELRARLASVETSSPAKREEALLAYSKQQARRFRALEQEGIRLEADLGWPPDEGDDYAPGLTDLGTGARPGDGEGLRVLYAALQRPQGLSPPQSALIREMILEDQTSAAPRGAFLFFSPATARARLPATLPAELAAEVAAFTRAKDELKTELRAALTGSDGAGSDLARTMGFGVLAEQQAAGFAALEERAEKIRRALDRLPARPAATATPVLPSALAARLTAYQNRRSELQQNARRDLRALRTGLPATGAELSAAGDPPRLRLVITGATTPELAAKQAAVDAFNRDYAERAAALNRELAELRGLLAASVPPASAHGKSVNDLIQDFTTAALRQASAETYRDCRAAVFQPGLSPEQRRLLLGRTPEKQSSLVFEF